MTQNKAYVQRNEDGAMRVGRLDISLDSVVIAFQQGYSPEMIQQMYPALTLEEVYGAITFYLANRSEVDDYLRQQESRSHEIRERTRANPSPVVARLRALSQATKTASP